MMLLAVCLSCHLWLFTIVAVAVVVGVVVVVVDVDVDLSVAAGDVSLGVYDSLSS